MTRTHAHLDSPIGPLLAVTEDDALVGLYMDGQRHLPAAERFGDPGRALAPLVEQLEAYFVGSLTTFDLPLRPAGTDFQRRVWAALREIPYGQTRTYGELAAELGSPTASRAVGAANGRNPISVVVPCHRVVGADGTLTGYAGGLARKQLLLDLEAATLVHRVTEQAPASA